MYGFSIGHRLPGGFYGRAYFAPYHLRVDETTTIRGGSARGSGAAIGFAMGVVLFWTAFLTFCFWPR